MGQRTSKVSANAVRTSDIKEALACAQNDDPFGLQLALKRVNDSGCNLDALHFTPSLVAAAATGRIRVCKVLLDFGADPVDCQNGSHAIHAAAKHGRVPVLTLLLDSLIPERTKWDCLTAPLCAHAFALAALRCSSAGSSAIHAAADKGHTRCLRKLLAFAARATAQARLIASLNPYTSAETTDVLRCVFAPSPERLTALHLAARRGDAAAARAVVAFVAHEFPECLHEEIAARSSAPADELRQDVFGPSEHASEHSTALRLAVASGHTDVARVLIDAGADAREVGGESATLLHAAVNVPAMASVAPLPLLKLLVEHGVQVDARNASGRTAFQVCHSLWAEGRFGLPGSDADRAAVNAMVGLFELGASLRPASELPASSCQQSGRLRRWKLPRRLVCLLQQYCLVMLGCMTPGVAEGRRGDRPRFQELPKDVVIDILSRVLRSEAAFVHALLPFPRTFVQPCEPALRGVVVIQAHV